MKKLFAELLTRRQLSRWQLLVLTVVATTVLIVLTLFGYSLAYADQILPKVSLGPVAVGGLTEDQAVAKVDAAIEQFTALRLAVDDEEPLTIPIDELGVSYDLKGSVAAAARFGQDGPLLRRAGQQLRSLLWPVQLELQSSVNEETLLAALKNHLYSRYDEPAQEVSLNIQKGIVTAVPGQAGLVLDHDAVRRELTLQLQRLSTDEIVLRRAVFEPQFSVNDATLAIAQATRIIAEPLTLTVKEQRFTISTDELGLWVTARGASRGDALYARFAAALPANSVLLLTDIDRQKLLAYIKTLAFEQVNSEPINAKVRFEEGALQVFQPSVSGWRLREDEAVEAVATALLDRASGLSRPEVALPTDELLPEITESSLSSLGIKELIGRAATDYGTSPVNRKHNIAVGAKKMSGMILAPGEQFSAVEALGEVNAAAGYLPELVISNNQLEKEYGGGLCQPITTLFRAVLDAGLPVDDRTNHSRRVSYYERASAVKGVRLNWDSTYANIGGGLVGYDATVYLPAPDLKFSNDTGRAILIQATVTNNRQVMFELYGTNDGRTVAVSKAQVKATREPPPPQFAPDPSKPSNTMEQVANPVPGATTSFSYTVTYANGESKSSIFESYYRAIPAQYLVGTAEPAPLPEGQGE